MNYRREIDGLRALAVLPVIFFHAGWSAFSGGFVGVDVFFVISGYLISSIIISELRAGSFSLARFYERRARRILPALIVVVLVCLPFAWAWLLPSDLKDFSKSVRAVFTFSSNVLFKHQSGYFDTAAELKPLLHTWSLAVEEQFYLVFPLLLWAFWRAGRAGILALVALCLLASLVYSEWCVGQQPAAAYFLLPSRAWELLIGAMLSLLSSDWGRQISSRGPAGLIDSIGAFGAAIGVGLVLGSMFLIDQNTPFPGLVALWPTLGAALIIAFASPRNIVGVMLGHRWLVQLGLVSYSAYLWHQPLFAFARHRFVDGVSPYLMGGLAVASLVLAYLTWRFVETPVRNKTVVSVRQLVALCSVSSVVLIALGVFGEKRNGFEFRLSAEEQRLFSYTRYDVKTAYREGTCFLTPEQTYKDFSPSCTGGSDVSGTAPILWGDSHAAALSGGLRLIQSDLMQFTASGCPPFVGYASSWRPGCRDFIKLAQREIAQRKPPQLYLHANWSLYKDDDLIKNLSRTLSFVRSVSPQTSVVLIGSVPQYHPSLPVTMLRHGVKLNGMHRMPMAMYGELVSIDQQIANLEKLDRVRFVSVLSRLCDDTGCLAVTSSTQGYVPMAWDYGHLTKEGAELIAAYVFQ